MFFNRNLKINNMELTGKCKEDFKKWLFENYTTKEIGGNWGWWIEKVPASFKHGVYVDFFDSVEIDISVSKDEDSLYESYVQYNDYQSSIRAWEETLNEARTEVIKEANEIYNQNK